MYLRSEFGLKLVIAENFRNDADGFIDKLMGMRCHETGPEQTLMRSCCRRQRGVNIYAVIIKIFGYGKGLYLFIRIDRNDRDHLAV